MNSSERLSAGLKALPDKISSFASTQAAWRFYQNESVSLSKLQEPLTAAAHQGILAHCMNFALCVHDWSRLSYKHANYPDTGGTSLNIEMIAEGVESMAELEAIKLFDCQEIQGYLISRPMPANELNVWYRSYVQQHH